jgi:hypothetical protein
MDKELVKLLGNHSYFAGVVDEAGVKPISQNTANNKFTNAAALAWRWLETSRLDNRVR